MHLKALMLAAVFVSVTAPLMGQPSAQRTAGAAPQAAADMKACQEAMQQHQAAMKEMDAMDARLGDQVKAMQSAQGQARVDAIARVVATMAEQRTQMRTRVLAMQERMMTHMMSHAGQDASAMKMCPMMQHMQQEGARGADQHQH